jgi:hypothetical protein
MVAFCGSTPCDFVLLLGDNFYPSGVKSVTDSQWKTAFVTPYEALGLTFYPTLGNHDYEGQIKEGSFDVDVCVARNRGQLLVNLVNTAGPHRTESILESIPPVGPLTVSIRHATRPTQVTLEPFGKPLDYEYRAGQILVTVPQVAIHGVIAVTANAEK